jgi:hypothetical protein
MRQSAKQRYGSIGENWALCEFQARGYEAKLISNWYDQFDILVNGLLPVEVKIGRSYLRKVKPGYYAPTWCFDTARIAPQQDYLLLLICQDQFNQFWPYLVSAHLIQGRQSIGITSHPRNYKGFWSTTLNRWSVIDWLIGIRERMGQQLPLMGTGDSQEKTHEWGQIFGSDSRFPELSPFPIGVSA